MELSKAINHKITIEPSHNMGFIVTIGCGKFVAQDVEVLLEDLAEYLKDPEKWEKEYSKIGPTDEIAPEARSERVEQPILPDGPDRTESPS